MNLLKISTCLLILPLAAACSHSSTSPQARSAPSAAPDTEEAPAAPSDGAFASGPAGETQAAPPSATAMESAGRADAPAPAAARRSAHSGSAYQPPAEKKTERPGLGTTWGETRTSYVSNQSFDRADYLHPFSLVSLNYNDQSGVQAMARRAGNA